MFGDGVWTVWYTKATLLEGCSLIGRRAPTEAITEPEHIEPQHTEPRHTEETQTPPLMKEVGRGTSTSHTFVCTV